MTTLTAEKIRMPFGYYKDSTLGEIAAADVLYLEHMAGQPIADTYLRDALAALVDQHRAAITRAKARGEKPRLFNPSTNAGPRPQQLKLL